MDVRPLNIATKCINDLVQMDTIKVWSLIVTVLGDLSKNSPKFISGKELRIILGHIGIKPEAVRVALHRLKIEGWIKTKKTGREVSYRLSSQGMKETKAVYNDIYRKTLKHTEWQLRLMPPDQEDASHLQVFKNVIFVPASASTQSNDTLDFSFKKEEVPQWLVDRVIAPEIQQQAVSLMEAIKDLDLILQKAENLDRAAIRLMALHRWRKMALRDNTWLHIWLKPDGSIAGCHRAIINLFEKLPRLSSNN